MNCYFSADIPEPGAAVELDESEYRHASAARRQRTGDKVHLINGEGRYGQGIITAISHSGITVEVVFAAAAESQQPEIILASAVAKGDRQTFLLDMVTQLGIDEYVPLTCERSVSAAGERQRDRWKRICRAGCKQSHNPRLPHIAEAASPLEFAQRMRHEGRPLYVAHPGGASSLPEGERESVALCIGPEGGFTSDEIAQLESTGASFVSLGPNILRIETAAVAAVCGFRRKR